MILDTSLSMEAQITAVTRTLYFYLQQIRQLTSYLSPQDLIMVIHATTLASKLDYCNLLFMGFPLRLIGKLQLVQNSVACSLTVSPIQVHIQPALCYLHWLSINGFISK